MIAWGKKVNPHNYNVRRSGNNTIHIMRSRPADNGSLTIRASTSPMENLSPHHRSSRPRCVVTLAHGTFARNAAWTQAGSYFCTSLMDRMLNDDVIITRFGWSGRNSPWSRKKAAMGLRAQLEKQLACYPDARHYVIGHSHGGAVALRAVYGDETLREHIAGVATLATPFIHVRERGNMAVNYTDMLTWICFLPLAALAAWEIFGLVLVPLLVVDNIFWGWSAAFVSTVGAGYVALFVAAWFSKVILRLAQSVSDSLPCPVPEGANVLIIRSSGDEASALLASSQLLSWFVSRIWDIAYRLLRPLFTVLHVFKRAGQIVQALLIMSSFVLLLLITLAIVMGDIGGAIASAVTHSPIGNSSRSQPMIVRIFVELLKPFTAHPDDRSFVEMAFALLFIGIIVLGGVFALLTLLVLPAVILLSLLLLPFGAESALAALLVELSVEAIPAGVWTVHQFGPIKGQGAGLSLMHSAAYADDRVLHLLACWMSQGGTKKEIA